MPRSAYIKGRRLCLGGNPEKTAKKRKKREVAHGKNWRRKKEDEGDCLGFISSPVNTTFIYIRKEKKRKKRKRMRDPLFGGFSLSREECALLKYWKENMHF